MVRCEQLCVKPCLPFLTSMCVLCSFTSVCLFHVQATSSSVSRRTGSMASMSGGDDMVYMEYRTSKPQHPLFKLRRHWTPNYYLCNTIILSRRRDHVHAAIDDARYDRGYDKLFALAKTRCEMASNDPPRKGTYHYKCDSCGKEWVKRNSRGGPDTCPSSKCSRGWEKPVYPHHFEETVSLILFLIPEELCITIYSS